MALLKLGRGLPALQQLSRAVASSGAGRIGILDQPSSRLAQFWWSSTSAGSDGKDKPKGQDDEAAAAAGAAAEGAQAREQADSQAQPSGPQSGPMTEGGTLLTPEEMMLQLTAAQASSKQLKEQVDQLTDRLKRSLAETENVRMRSAREVETAKKFGPQSLVKDLLDIPDNLERAAASVPEDALAGSSGNGSEESEKLRGLLKGLLEGVRATEKILLQVLRKQGVEQYNPLGEKFDPNFHNALFEVPDGTKEVGHVAVVTKRGYKMHDRVIRPAEVGVVRAP